MAIDYTITAFKTRYEGRLYRSRLEAKWAAFFDLCGWQVEYEPYDIGEWSPDFLITGKFQSLLVEIKPIDRIDSETCDRMTRAAIKANHDGELLLLGVSPFYEGNWPPDHPYLGWLGEKEEREENSEEPNWWFDTELCPFAWYSERPSQVDFCSAGGSFRGRLTGLYDGGSFGDAMYHAADRVKCIRGLWAEAASKVQWHRRP